MGAVFVLGGSFIKRVFEPTEKKSRLDIDATVANSACVGHKAPRAPTSYVCRCHKNLRRFLKKWS
jgi:hypothetical protein